MPSVIGLDPSNHGTLTAVPVCAVARAPAFWQQRTGSAFLAVLNAGQETYPGISYTQIYTDEVVTPNVPPPAARSELHTGPGDISNIAVQQVRPGHIADHLSMGSTDPVGYVLVVAALTHDEQSQQSAFTPKRSSFRDLGTSLGPHAPRAMHKPTLRISPRTWRRSA